MAVDLGSTFKDLIDEVNKKAQTGKQGYGFVASVSRPSFTEALWTTYGSTGHTENWSNTADIRNGCRIGDLFIIVGTATDTGNAHMAIYRSDTSSGTLHGECIAHFVALRGKDGANGKDGVTPTIKAQAGANINKVGEPTVTATTNGTTTTFTFDNLKGEKGDTPSTEKFALKTEMPTKTSELENDSGFINKHQDISGKANIEGGNTFKGTQVLQTPTSDGYSIQADGYIKGSWLQAPSTGHKIDSSTKVAVINNAGWFYYRTPTEILLDGDGVKQVKINGETKSPDANGLIDLGTISSGGGGVGGYLHHITITGNAPSVDANLKSHGGNVSFLIRNDVSTPYTSVDDVKNYIRNLGYSYYDTTKNYGCVGVGTNSSGETVYGYGLYIGSSNQIVVNGEVYTTDGAKNSSYIVYGNQIKDNVIELPKGENGEVTETAFPDPTKTYVLWKGSTFSMYSNPVPNVTFEWGDGTTSFFTQADGTITHTYTDGKEYHQVAISGYPSFGNVFEDETGIISVIIGNTVTEINGTFWSCSNLESATIPESVIEIGGSTFNSCTNLKTITIPESVTTIGGSAFRYCSNLKEVRFLSSTPSGIAFDSGIFDDCPNLERIIVPKDAYNAYLTQLSAYKDKIVYEVYSNDTSNFVTLDGRQDIVGAKWFDDVAVNKFTAFPYGIEIIGGQSQQLAFHSSDMNDTTMLFDGDYSTISLNGDEGKKGQVLTSQGSGATPKWTTPSSSGSGGMPIYIKANTGVRSDGNYNVNVTILAGRDNLQVGDRIQICKPHSSRYNYTDDNGVHKVRRRKRIKCAYYCELTEENIKNTNTFSIELDNTDTNGNFEYINRSFTSGVTKLRRPLSVRVVRCHDWSNTNNYEVKQISNIVSIGTSKDLSGEYRVMPL